MPIDISLVSSNVVITEVSGHKKGWKPMSASYEFDANNNLLLTINGQTRSIGLSDLTVSGVAPANVNAAITALAAVFLNAGGTATTTFTALTGTAWDGTNKYTTLTGNTALTLSVGSNVSGILNVYQDATGSRTLSINGVSFTINTAANSVTGIGYYVTNGVINFTVDTGLIQYTPDTTAPVVNTLTATDSHTVQAAMSESVSGTVAGWSFTQNGTTITPTSVSGTTTRSFVFSQTFLSTDVITASYNSVTGDTVDAAGNEVVTFSARSVTNSVAAAFTSVNRWAFYKNSSMVRSAGTVTQWTNADGDTTRDFVQLVGNPYPIDATTDGMQLTAASTENLKYATQQTITGSVTMYALIKRTGTGALLGGLNSNGYGIYTDATTMFFSAGANAEGFQQNATGIANMSAFHVLTLVWTPGSQAKVYLDGVVVGTFTGTITSTGMTIKYVGGFNSDKFIGYINGMALFNAAHDASTVATQYSLFQTAATS
jgi:hypothetical protein